MATNAVHKGERLDIVSFDVAHKAGELVYQNGFFGVVEEDVVAGGRGYMILGEVWRLPRLPANAAMGTKVYAVPTAVATQLQLYPEATGIFTAAVGRVEATGNASGVGRVLIFGPSAY